METILAERSTRIPIDSPVSEVSWGAVLGGAFVTAALWLALLALGAGFGLSIVSPWTNVGASAAAVGTTAIVWLVVSQVIASGAGGYLAGRLRRKPAPVHTDEVYFRDTANGFLVWAVALAIGAFALASAATSVIDTSSVSSQTTTLGPEPVDPNSYYVDMLFRSDNATPATPAPAAEVGRIVASALTRGEMSTDDKRHLGKIVASRTGLAQNDAERRVEVVIAEARQAADTVRKVAAHLLLWTFLALLMGAFVSSYAATIGGRQRDHVKALG